MQAAFLFLTLLLQLEFLNTPSHAEIYQFDISKTHINLNLLNLLSAKIKQT